MPEKGPAKTVVESCAPNLIFQIPAANLNYLTVIYSGDADDSGAVFPPQVINFNPTQARQLRDFLNANYPEQ